MCTHAQTHVCACEHTHIHTPTLAHHIPMYTHEHDAVLCTHTYTHIHTYTHTLWPLALSTERGAHSSPQTAPFLVQASSRCPGHLRAEPQLLSGPAWAVTGNPSAYGFQLCLLGMLRGWGSLAGKGLFCPQETRPGSPGLQLAILQVRVRPPWQLSGPGCMDCGATSTHPYGLLCPGLHLQDGMCPPGPQVTHLHEAKQGPNEPAGTTTSPSSSRPERCVQGPGGRGSERAGGHTWPTRGVGSGCRRARP